MTTPTGLIVRVRCHAAAPGGTCNHVIGDVPGPLHFVATAARRPDRSDGRVWLQCPKVDCRTWNVFDSARGHDA